MNKLTIVDLHKADELSLSSMARIVGGDRKRNAAVIEAYKVIDRIDLELIEVEPVTYVPMKL